MAINIENQDVECLLNEIVQMTGESKPEAVRQALAERLERLTFRFGTRQNEIRLLAFLQNEVWPHILDDLRGARLTKAEAEGILGYEENGV